MARFIRLLFSFKALIASFFPGLEVQSGQTIVVDGAKVMTYSDDEFEVVEGSDDEEAVIKIQRINGGSFG